MAAEALVDVVTQLLSTLVLVSGVFILAFFLSRLHRKKDIFASLWPHALPLAFLVALVATFGSLFYSEVAGWNPCKLCWLQRIFMYPLTIILGMAWWKKLKGVHYYVVPLAAIGAVIATYHYYLQRFPSLQLIPCDPAAGACSIVYTFTYGYITIPMMALTGFILILIFMHKMKK